VLWAIAVPCAVDAYRQKPFAPSLWTKYVRGERRRILLVGGWRAANTGFRVAIMLLLILLLYIGPASESLLYTSIDTTNRDDFQALMRST
jgi:hypothetical protein